MEKAGIPSATICTDPFERTAKGMASMWGAADYPTIFTAHGPGPVKAHPLGGLDREAIRRRAEGLLDEVVAVLTGGGGVPGVGDSLGLVLKLPSTTGGVGQMTE